MKPTKPAAPRPIYLKDYRPPAYLIDEVDLDVALDPTRTRVRARLSVRPNAARPARAAARLDGSQLELQSIAVDGRTLGTKDYKLTDDLADAGQAAGQAVHARDRHDPQSGGQQGAAGPLPLQRRLLHAVRGRRLPPHHLFPRPPRRARHLHGAHRGGRREAPVLLANGNPRRARHARRAASATTPSGTTRFPKPSLSVCPRRRRSRLHRIDVHHHVGAQGGARASTSSTARRSALRLGDGLAEARHALGRGPLRPRVRSRRVQHRRRVGLQHGRDGEQGPQRLQRPADPRLAGDRDRRQLRGDRGASSRTSTSTTGPATASPAATGSSSASRKG